MDKNTVRRIFPSTVVESIESLVPDSCKVSICVSPLNKYKMEKLEEYIQKNPEYKTAIIKICNKENNTHHTIFYNCNTKKIHDSWRDVFLKNFKKYLDYYDDELFTDDNMFEEKTPQQHYNQGVCVTFAVANAYCAHYLQFRQQEERLTNITADFFKKQLHESHIKLKEAYYKYELKKELEDFCKKDIKETKENDSETQQKNTNIEGENEQKITDEEAEQLFKQLELEIKKQLKEEEEILKQRINDMYGGAEDIFVAFPKNFEKCNYLSKE